MLAKLIIVRVLDLVEVILVQLPDERGEVGVFEHPGQYRFCEFVHVLDDKTVASGTPRNDMLEVGIFEHPEEFGQFSMCLQTGSAKRNYTCKASSQNRKWKTSNPLLSHVSTRWTGSYLTLGVLCGEVGGTLVSRTVEVSGRGRLSGWTDSARVVGRVGGRRRRGKSGGDRERIWSWFEGGSLSGGG